MRVLFENVINKGGYDLSKLLAKIDSYHIEDKLTDEDRDSLYAMAREKANVSNSVDLYSKVVELEKRVKVLEDANVVEDTETEDTTEEVTYAEYEDGKWYYAGDKVIFDGLVYECIAPDGVVCVWSPSAYPAYWQLAE